jgi:hypothetical protein
MSETCSANVNIRNASKFVIFESQENILFGRHSVHRRIILKGMLRKYGVEKEISLI